MKGTTDRTLDLDRKIKLLLYYPNSKIFHTTYLSYSDSQPADFDLGAVAFSIALQGPDMEHALPFCLFWQLSVTTLSFFHNVHFWSIFCILYKKVTDLFRDSYIDDFHKHARLKSSIRLIHFSSSCFQLYDLPTHFQCKMTVNICIYVHSFPVFHHSMFYLLLTLDTLPSER